MLKTSFRLEHAIQIPFQAQNPAIWNLWNRVKILDTWFFGICSSKNNLFQETLKVLYLEVLWDPLKLLEF